jgi:S1-C subfamily serine protease
VVAAVGTAGVVAVTLGGALVLGLRGQPGGAEGPGVQASTAIVPSPSPSEPVQRAWLGIEGYDQRAAVQGAAPTPPPTELAPTEGEDSGLDGSDVTVPTETPVDGPPVAGSGEGGSAPDPGTTATSADVPEAGVVVAAVDPDGPAAAALQPGDIVLEVDGEPVEDMATLLAALRDYRPGDQVEITYETNGSGQPGTTMTALVTLAERPAHMGS